MGQHGGACSFIGLVHLSVSGSAWWYYKACSFIQSVGQHGGTIGLVHLLVSGPAWWYYKDLFIYQSVGQHGGTIRLVHLSVSGSTWWYYKACSLISQWVSMVVL